MKKFLMLSVALVSSQAAAADFKMIHTPTWSAAVPTQVSLPFASSSQGLPAGECKKFKAVLDRAQNHPNAEADSFEFHRDLDPGLPMGHFLRTFTLTLPQDENLMSSQVRAQLISAQPKAAGGLPATLLVPEFLNPELTLGSTLSTGGSFESLGRELGVKATGVEVEYVANNSLQITVHSKDVYCDLVDPNARPVLHLQVRAQASVDDEIAFRSFYTPLATALNPVFDRKIGPTQRAALLGFHAALFVEKQIPGLSEAAREKIVETLLDRFVNFDSVERSDQWADSLGTMLPKFTSQSEPFPIDVSLF